MKSQPLREMGLSEQEQDHLKIPVRGTAADQLGLGEPLKALECVLKEQLYRRGGKQP